MKRWNNDSSGTWKRPRQPEMLLRIDNRQAKRRKKNKSWEYHVNHRSKLQRPKGENRPLMLTCCTHVNDFIFSEILSASLPNDTLGTAKFIKIVEALSLSFCLSRQSVSSNAMTIRFNNGERLFHISVTFAIPWMPEPFIPRAFPYHMRLVARPLFAAHISLKLYLGELSGLHN